MSTLRCALAAAEALERIGGGAAEGVAQALVTGTTDVRERAAAILGSINSDECSRVASRITG